MLCSVLAARQVSSSASTPSSSAKQSNKPPWAWLVWVSPTRILKVYGPDVQACVQTETTLPWHFRIALSSLFALALALRYHGG